MKKILFNKARNDVWEESDVCMSIIARFGTGGGNTPIVLIPTQSERYAQEITKESEHNMSTKEN